MILRNAAHSSERSDFKLKYLGTPAGTHWHILSLVFHEELSIVARFVLTLHRVVLPVPGVDAKLWRSLLSLHWLSVIDFELRVIQSTVLVEIMSFVLLTALFIGLICITSEVGRAEYLLRL